MIKVISEHIMTARITHYCDHFSCVITPGTRYKMQAQINDNGFDVYKAHLDCDEVATEIWYNANLSCDETINLGLSDLSDDADWIIEKYPAVAARFGLVARYDNDW